VYKHILIALDNSPTDSAIIEHIQDLLRLTNAQATLIHVADGFVARNQETFNLEDSEEMIVDRAYLEQVRDKLRSAGFTVNTILSQGDPAKKIVKAAHDVQCDLIAMATHGHRFLGDLILGSVASSVRHLTDIPVLLVPGKKKK
jgi:nucleotide-binding universal stress UspA family protein